MSIVKYYGIGLARKFNVDTAIRDGGWAANYDSLKFPLKVWDRQSGERATITEINYMPEYHMYQCCFKGGGWLLLDHAIEQYGSIASATQSRVAENTSP